MLEAPVAALVLPPLHDGTFVKGAGAGVNSMIPTVFKTIFVYKNAKKIFVSNLPPMHNIVRVI